MAARQKSGPTIITIKIILSVTTPMIVAIVMIELYPMMALQIVATRMLEIHDKIVFEGPTNKNGYNFL